MRPSARILQQTTIIPVAAASEYIERIEESKTNKTIIVVVSYLDSEGNYIASIKHYIIDDNYDLIMSESPGFAPGKPANEYREEDLWYVIDLINPN